MTPKGKLISIGGAEDKGTDLEKGEIHRNNLNFFELGILKRIVEEAGGVNARIEVITTASSIPYEVGDNYLDAFGKIGCLQVDVMHIRDRGDANKLEFLERAKQADVMMFSGGNQLRLSATFGGTDFLQIIKERYYQEEGFVIAGTSAGAMAMSPTMIYEGSAALAHLKGSVKMTAGLGLQQGVIIDSHFDKRGRFGRLAQAVAANPSCIGIGLGEDTGVIIHHGKYLETVGSGPVIIVDGHAILHNSIADIPEGNPISIENLKVHFMSAGNAFNLQTRSFSAESIHEATKTVA